MSQTPPFDLLTQPQRDAVISLVSGDSPRRAAALANVTERTLRRWRNQPVFRAALAEARVDFFSACRSHVNASIVSAFEVLSAKAGYNGVPRGNSSRPQPSCSASAPTPECPQIGPR